MDYYYTVEQRGTAEFKDRGSRFIACLIPLASADDFKKEMELVKKAFPKATHYCFAYRIGLDGNHYRVSDAGEPSGTAGKPIFGLIESRQLTNILIVVVRYFGGTLLGVPGLINAYRSAAALVLQTVPVIQKPVERQYRLQFDYTIMNTIMTIIKQYNCSVAEQQLQLFCTMTIGIPQNRLEEVLFKLKEIRGLEIGAEQG
ncbi:YigZ family protein [Agriterribacter sp.]|uniref:IMPACT family protein n=1 Tax=Agriterribacter sp. TaxID=2821509 RepID=UPI002CFBA559|nr:YigZ family protein [Agriterribacter sp.]HRO47637.1 YigZ family protein [Agriterribacter sp.]HRQ17640.1 YigZ family protein [Agriterribacter sp.]